MDFFLDGLAQGFRLLTGLDPEVYGIAWVSLRVSLLAVAVAALLGLPLGFVIAQKAFPGRRAVILVFNTLMSLPTVAVGLIVFGLLSHRGALGALDLLYTPTAMTLAQALLAWPLITALTIAAVSGLDARAKATALTLGASRRQAALMVFKEARLAIMAALAAAFGRVVTEVGAAIMVGGNIRHYTRTLTTAIALETGKGEFALGLALGAILLVIALGVNLLGESLQARWR